MPYKRSGDHLFWYDERGKVMCCVACGRPVEHNMKREACHKCPPKVEAAKKAANTRLEDPIERTPSFGERLSDGVAMLRLSGDMDDS